MSGEKCETCLYFNRVGQEVKGHCELHAQPNAICPIIIATHCNHYCNWFRDKRLQTDCESEILETTNKAM